MRRVVITGLGIVSCLGNNQDEVYQSLLNSKSGISFSKEYKEHNLRSHIHGKPNIKLEDHVDRKTIRFMGSGSAYNYIAMKEAISDSGLEDKDVSNFKRHCKRCRRCTSHCSGNYKSSHQFWSFSSSFVSSYNNIFY